MADETSGDPPGNEQEALLGISEMLVSAEEVEEDEDGAEATPYSEDDLALRFTAKHKDCFRYVAIWGQWMFWDGTVWIKEQTFKAFDLSRAICRQAAEEADSGRKELTKAKTVAAVVTLARADRKHAATADQWDNDLFLLNTPEGTVDLRNGGTSSNRPEDYLTKITAVSPGGPLKLWPEFLKRITDGDNELQKFLQRMIGYGLTGSTQEHAFFFLYGTGANGKSVFLNTVSGMIGDYAKTAPVNTFVKMGFEHHPTELAGLRGARLVSAIETEEGKKWAENKIKSLTGGDKIAARFMRQDFFEFMPQFKLIVAGNHRPGLDSVDEAMKRRMNLVPFTVTIPPEDRDDSLADKMKDEWPGILQWAIEGCLEWQERGLDPPQAVRKATDEYLDSEDALSTWIMECCDTKQTHYSLVADLYQSWKTWAIHGGETAGSLKSFSQNLAERFERKPQPGTNKAGFKGISIREKDMSEEYWNQ